MESNEGRRSLTNETLVKKPKGMRFEMEAIMFMFFVAKTFSDTVIVNLLEKSTCLVILNYDVQNCTDPVSPTTEGLLQQSTADLIMARTMIEAFFPSLLSLFIGPWSDTNGRLPLILLSLTGYFTSSLMWGVMTLIPGLHPVYFLLTSVPVALGGGYVSFFLALYCYISDITEFDRRAFRMSLLEAALMGGVLVSSLLTPYLLNVSVQFGFTLIFATSAFLMLLILLYTYFVVEESVNVVESERTKLWQLDHVKEIFTTCFRSRPNHIRTIVMCLIVNLVIFIIVMEGELSVVYMFTQKKFGWNLLEYTRFTSFFILVAGVSVIGSTWLFISILKLADLPLMFAGTLCLVSKSFMQAIASTSLFLYVSCGFCVLSVLVSPLSRSQLSKLIPPDDLGKIFAFTAFLEATSPITASPLYTFVYKATMNTLPNTVFWLSTGLGCVSLFLVGTALVLHRMSPSVDSSPLLSNDEEGGSTVQA